MKREELRQPLVGPDATPSELQQQSSDSQAALTTLAQQLALRSSEGRPMRASMERAYRTLLEREHGRLLHTVVAPRTPPDEHLPEH